MSTLAQPTAAPTPLYVKVVRHPVLPRIRTIRLRLVLGFGTCLLLLGISGATSYGLLQRTNVRSQEAVSLLRDEYDVVQRTVTTILREMVAGVRYLKTGTVADEARYVALMEEADQLRREAIALPILAAAERRELEEIGLLQGSIEVGLAVARAYSAVGREGDAVRVLEQTAMEVDRIERALENLRDNARHRAAERQEQMEGDLTLAEIVLLITVLLALPIAAYFWFTTARAITRPLESFGREMNLIGAGDLRLPDRPKRWNEGADEFVHLATALDQARDRLRSLLGEVQRQADQVSAASAELAASAGGAADSTQHVTSAVTEMAEGAASQLDALNQASDAVRQLAEEGAAIDDAAAASERAGLAIQETATVTRAGIGRAIETLLAARETTETSAQEIAALRDATASIDGFVAVIADIASQTNLLALNAAIEAARAGQAGRGFAVVAEEVRRLADQSAQAADEVADAVRGIRQRVGSASGAAEAGVTRMRDVAEVAGGAGNALAQIEVAVQEVQSAAERVGQAVNANRTTIRTVEESIVTARDAAQNHAATAEEVAASTEETSASAEEVSATAELLKTAASRIRGMVTEFRT